MSFGDLEYQETTSNNLARTLKSIRQEQIILDAVQNPIDDIEEFPNARQVESVKGTKDRLGAVVLPVAHNWQLPLEPNENTRLWLWFREGWRLKDHSHHGNSVFASQVEPSPYPIRNYVPLRRKANDDGTTDGRYYGIINGLSQYYRVHDGPENRMSDLLVSKNEVCFSIFFSPFDTYTFDPETGLFNLFSKLDDDQIENAIQVQLSEDGAIYWRVIYQGNSYSVNTADHVIPELESPEFIPEEFIEDEFITKSIKEYQYNADIAPPDWTWLFFTFNKTTRQLKIFKVTDGSAATELVTSPSEAGIRTTFAAHLPINEGGTDATTAYDMINDNNAVFGTTTAKPTWQAAPNRSLRFNGDLTTATITNHASIDALSVFTIAFKLRLQAYSPDASLRAVISKAVNAATVAGSFVMFINANGSKVLQVSLRNNANDFRAVVGPSNSIANLNQWYDVVLTYDGSNYVLTVGGVAGVATAASGDVITNTLGIKVGATISAGIKSIDGEIAHLIIDKGTAWNATKKAWFASLVPGGKALDLDWKPPKPPEPEEPLPVVRPMSIIYDRLTDEVDTVKVNALQLTTPFESKYNVAGGSPATTPEELKYDCPDGTSGGSTTSPTVTIYNLAAASSTGNIANTELAYVQRIYDSDSVLHGENPTYLQFWVDSDGNATGTVFPCIFYDNGTYLKFGSGIAASSLGSGWVLIEGSSYVTRAGLATGDGVGIVWEGSTAGAIKVRRGGTDNHYDDAGGVIHSYQAIHNGTAWANDNDQYSIAGIVKTGNITTAGSNPYYPLDATNWAIANWQQNSTLENIAPAKVIWRVRRKGSAASATVVCRIRNGSGTLLFTFPQTISFDSIATTIQDIEFSDPNNSVQWQDTYRITLEYAVKTGINDTTNLLEVNYNVGPSNAGFVGGTSVKAQYYRGDVLTGWADVSPVCDWAGKIYIGGANFTSYINLDNLTTRVGEKVNQWTSPNISKLFNLKLSKWIVTLKKEGTPSGTIRVKIYNTSGAFLADFDTILDASSLTTSDSQYVFQKPTNSLPMDQQYRIVVHYEGGTTTNKVLVKVNTNTAAGAEGDGTKSILSRFTSGAWVDDQNLDVAGEMFIGGIPDVNSRPMVAVRCDSIFSQIYKDKVTKCVVKLKKLGAPTGNYFFRTVRGSDNSNRDLIGSGDIAALSSTVWTTITKENFTAIHFIGESDKFAIEYNGGDPNNCLLVMVDKTSTYDDEDTQYEEYNGVSWLKNNPTWDLAGVQLWTGGDTYTPDAGTPYVEPPDFYDHDLLIGAGSYVKDVFTSFYGMRIRDFRLETSIPTLEEMDTLFDNKYSRRGGKGQVALVGWFTLDSETAPPE